MNYISQCNLDLKGLEKMYKTGIKESREYATEITCGRYPQADKRKFSKKLYCEDIQATHIAGQLAMSRAIMDKHKKDPYKSVDELMGDLQLIAMESFNFCQRKLTSRPDMKIGLDYFLEKGGV